MFESILDNVEAKDTSSSDRIKKADMERLMNQEDNINVEPEKYKHLFVISYAVDYYKMDRQSGYLETIRDDFKEGLEVLREEMSKVLGPDNFKASLVLIQEHNNYTQHTLDLYNQLEIPINNNIDDPFINWGNDRARFDVEDGIRVNLRFQFNLKGKSVRFYTKFMRRFIPIVARMMRRTDKDLSHSEVQCYTFLLPEWANDPEVVFFCELDELYDELIVSYKNDITFVYALARSYCAINKVHDEEYKYFIDAFRKESEHLTDILNKK